MTPEQIEELADNLEAAKKHDGADDWIIENRHTIARQVLAQAAEIARLKARLEIDHYWQLDADGNATRIDGEPIADGIECRDDTIALLEVEIARLKAMQPTDDWLETWAEEWEETMLFIEENTQADDLINLGRDRACIAEIRTILAARKDMK